MHEQEESECKHYLYDLTTILIASEERFPVLFLDVNLGGGRIKRLIIKDGDDCMKVASEFCKENSNISFNVIISRPQR